MLRKRETPPWTVMGVDNGTRLAVVESPGGSMTRAQLHAVKLSQHAPARRCYEGSEWMRQLVAATLARDPQPIHVFIESPFVGPRVSAVIPLSRLQGALMVGAYAGGASAVYDVSPSQWKMGLFGKGHGNANKDYISDWMLTRWPWLYESAVITMRKDMIQDAIDAGGVMLYGSGVLSRAAHLTEGVLA